VDPDLLRRRNLARSLTGWAVMVVLMLLVAAGAYLGVNALADRITGRPLPSVPGLPSLPEQPAGGLGGWLDGLFGDDSTMVVNIAEGLNLRDRAGLDSTVIDLVPNGTPVTILEGPVVVDNIPWARARAEFDGRQVEGWLSMNYLRPKE
jgi:eukaryotic-like serine/threonine-protein kinase